MPPGETLEQIAQDFGVHSVTLSKWLRQADIENGIKPSVTTDQAFELCEAQAADPKAGAGERGPSSRCGVPVPGASALP